MRRYSLLSRAIVPPQPGARCEFFGRAREPQCPGRQLAGPFRLGGVLVVGDGRASRGRHPAERGRPIERDGEVALEQPAKDAVGQFGDLGRPGRRGRSGHHRVDRRDHLRAALKQVRRPLRILPDQQPQQVDAPQRPRQALRVRP